MTPADVEAHPLVVATGRLAVDLLDPAAAEVDASVVPRTHLDALGAVGVLGMAGPGEAGAEAVPAAVVRRVHEIVAGADLATWFVQAQHHAPVRALAAAGGFETLLGDLTGGRRVAGIAFSHLRRWPERPVRARRVAHGWVLDGAAPWYTGWGLNDIALVGAATEAGDVVLGLVDPVQGPTLTASAPLALAALQSTRTVRLELNGHVVRDAEVVAVRSSSRWARDDARTTVNVVPAVFGVSLSALSLLAAVGERRLEPAAVAAATRLGAQVEAVKQRCYELLDSVDPDDATRERLTLRAQAHRLMVEATTALVVAGSGAAMALANPAQRKAREALFLLVQAQTVAARTVALDATGMG